MRVMTWQSRKVGRLVGWQGGEGGRVMRWEDVRFLVLFKDGGCRVIPRFHLCVSDVNPGKEWTGCIVCMHPLPFCMGGGELGGGGG